MNPIRIGVDARPLSTPMSGVGKIIHETIRCYPHPKDTVFYLFSHNPIHSHHNSILSLNYVEWVQGKTFLSKKGGLFFTFELPKTIKKYNLDLFWGPQQVLPPCLDSQLPTVIGYMDLVLYKYPKTMRTIARWQQRLYQSYSVNRADYIVAISENTRNDMIQKFRYPIERTMVAYPGIDPEEIESLLSRKESPRIARLPEKYILSVSTIEPRKNYGFLLKVFKKIRKHLPGYHWIIAGKKGWESKEFYNQINYEREKYQDILIMEDLDDSEIHHLYKNCSLFWMASLYEGFGIPVVEALYHNKMLILSNIPTFQEIGGKNLIYLPAKEEKDIELWVQTTLHLIHENKKPEVDLSQFTWKESAKTMSIAFQKAIQVKRVGIKQ